MDLWQIRKLGTNNVLRKCVKFIFSVIFYDGRLSKVKRGPLKGLYWCCCPQHQFWMPLGIYEKETANWLESQLKLGMTFFDVGANAGYFTLLGSKCVGSGSVIAFEPIPLNVETIKKHIAANKINNVVLENIALSDSTGYADFIIEKNNANSHLSDIDINHAISSAQLSIKVPLMTLDDYVNINHVAPDVIKIDVEGAETHVLYGAREVLKAFHPVCIVSTHSRKLHYEVKEFFISSEYLVTELHGFEHELLCFPCNKG